MSADILSRDLARSDLELAASATYVLDAFDIATSAWTRTLELCADMMGLADPEAAADQMRRGNTVARMHCCHGLAEQMAAALRSSYQTIQAVYAPYCEACPQSFCIEEGIPNVPLVHLLIWAQQKPPTLGARAAALGNALARVCQDLTGLQELPNMLQARVLDDSDLEKLFGGGRRKRWSVQLQAYLLGMDGPVQEV
jgi:hypothetical protein